ncbi:MAG: gliding motility-associated C-terminal domain-containing protein [Flavobacteriales bacterium]
MTCRFSLFSLLFLFFHLCFAQNSSNIWHFGQNAGLDFNSGTPVAIGDGQLVTQEGCATICDEVTGDLLFYTDGSTVYNANHQIMPNGTGLNGHASSTQSAVVVQKPGSSHIYTIFTMDVDGGSEGLQFTEVDMTLDGGLGDVITPINTVIFTSASEKLAAVQHQNGIDYWIVVHDLDTEGIRSFLYTSTGIVGTGVTSMSSTIPTSFTTTVGYMKASLNGNFLALAISFSNQINVYSFNNSTGLATSLLVQIDNMTNPYGLEFSVNEQFLYVGPEICNANNNLSQYDLEAGTTADIINSKVTLSNNFSNRGALQLGPDQRIYCSNYLTNVISIIETPDLQGVNCSLIDTGLFLTSGTLGRLGLPTFVNNSTFENNLINLCLGDSVELIASQLPNPNWATADNPSIILSQEDTLTVSPLINTTFIAFSGPDTISFSIEVRTPISFSLGQDICTASGTITLDVTQPEAVEYLWQDGSDSNIFEVTENGLYWVEITNGPCITRDSIFIQFQDLLIQSPGQVECDSTATLMVNDSNPDTGHWVYLGPPGSPKNVVFSPDSTSINTTVTVPELGEYIFTYINICGDSISKATNFISKEPNLNIISSQQCNFDINLQAINPIQNGVWSVEAPTGESVVISDVNNPNTSATVSNYGMYTFTYTYDFCKASFSQHVEVLSIAPIITTQKTHFICDFEAVLTAEVPNHFEQWNVISGPGILTFSSFENMTTNVTVSDYGTYIIEAKGCGKSDTIELTFEKQQPQLLAPEYVECALEAIIEFDFLGPTGEWTLKPNGDETITLDTSSIQNHAIISSDRYGSVVVTLEACDTSISRDIIFMCELELPNVFTPNNDPLNPYFTINRLNTIFYSQSTFTVFNRWGVEVYRNGQYGLHGSWWNGNTNDNKPLDEGLYFYELKVKNKINNKDEIYKGRVSIFR